ncbi:MAG: class I adenylate-forming enzyme family protein [Thermoanaerobaculia bacterium]
MSLSDALGQSSRRDPRRPALLRGGEILDQATLAALIDAAAGRLASEAPEGPLPLDASDPFALAVGFFAARRAGRTAVVHAEGVPALLRREREERLRTLLPAVSSETVFFSSGSVSRGKAVPLSEEQLLFSALAYPERTGISPADRVAVAVPAGQIFGFLRGIVNSLLVGAQVIFLSPRRDPLGEAEGRGATFVLLSPAQAKLSSAAGGALRLRGALTAGGPMAEAAAGRLESERSVPIRFGYGLTETAALGSRQHFDRPRRPGSSGLPAPGLTIDIVTPDGLPATPGETGEIRISGKSVFRGYADPREPAPFDARGCLRSGDLGFFDEEGELHVRGREAASISAHGRFLCAEEVEGAVLEKPGVAEAAAVPLGDAFGLLLVAEDSSPAFLAEVREHLARRLPLFARPRRVARVEEIPRTSSGKLDRLAAARCFETS